MNYLTLYEQEIVDSDIKFINTLTGFKIFIISNGVYYENKIFNELDISRNQIIHININNKKKKNVQMTTERVIIHI